METARRAKGGMEREWDAWKLDVAAAEALVARRLAVSRWQHAFAVLGTRTRVSRAALTAVSTEKPPPGGGSLLAKVSRSMDRRLGWRGDGP
jgi:hypothetical protein